MIAATAVMFVVYLIIPLSTPHTYISPDETANAYFAEQFAQTGRLWFIDSLNLDAFDRIHPRSTESHGGLVHPSGWWGISLLYGVIGSFTHASIMHILTAMIALLAVWLFTYVIEKIFDTPTATISFFILLTHPAWWYYTSRGWHHNTLLVSLLMILAWFIVCKPWQTAWAQYTSIISLTFLAILIRPVALLWVVPIILIIRFTKPAYARAYDAILVTGIITALLTYIIHTQLWTSIAYLTPASSIQSHTPSIIEYLFPHGYNFVTVARSIFWYGIAKFWWLTILAGVGTYRIIVKNKSQFRWITNKDEQFGERKSINPFEFGRKSQKTDPNANTHIWYVIITITTTAILALWYGSWQLSDNPDPSYITLANSYVRYWLPAYILAIPLAVRGLMFIIKKINAKHGFTIAIILLLALSTQNVLSGRDGIPATIKQLKTNAEISEKVQEITPWHAIIITNRHDKLFFPQRRIIFPIDHPGTFESINALKETHPLFIYSLKMADHEIERYNEVLEHMNLKLISHTEFGNEHLYIMRDQ